MGSTNVYYCRMYDVMGSTIMSYCRMYDEMGSTIMSYCRLYCNVICNNGDALPKTSYIRSTLHHILWQLCLKRWKQLSEFGPFSCNSQITTGETNAHKPATGPSLAPDESSRTLLLPFFTVHFNPLNAELNPIYHLLALLGVHHFLHVSSIRVNIISSVSTFNFKMRKTRKQVPWKALGVCLCLPG